MFHVYVPQSNKTGRRYVGSCEIIADRLARHNARHSKATRHGIPWTPVDSEASLIGLKLQEESAITRRVGVRTNLIDSSARTVAEATGRGLNPLQN